MVFSDFRALLLSLFDDANCSGPRHVPCWAGCQSHHTLLWSCILCVNAHHDTSRLTHPSSSATHTRSTRSSWGARSLPWTAFTVANAQFFSLLSPLLSVASQLSLLHTLPHGIYTNRCSISAASVCRSQFLYPNQGSFDLQLHAQRCRVQGSDDCDTHIFN